MFTICVLAYDQPTPAGRCFSSLERNLPSPLVSQIRIGLNAPTLVLDRLVAKFAERESMGKREVLVYREKTSRNVGKYPLMRRMLHGTPAVESSHVMWFDDDSYLSGKTKGWWEAAAVAAQKSVVAGPIYVSRTPPFKPGQLPYLESQPWWGGKSVTTPGYKTRFAQGGFWIAEYAFLRDNDYPTKVLRHNGGGDILLGEIVRQRGHEVYPFGAGVCENADDKGKRSGAKTRGARVDWSADLPLEHHDFEVVGRAYRAGHVRNQFTAETGDQSRPTL